MAKVVVTAAFYVLLLCCTSLLVVLALPQPGHSLCSAAERAALFTFLRVLSPTP